MKMSLLILIFFLSGCKTTMAADWAPIDETTVTKMQALEILDERTRNLLNQNFTGDTNLTYFPNNPVIYNYGNENHENASGTPLTNKNWFKKMRYGDETLNESPGAPFIMNTFSLPDAGEYVVEGLILISRASAFAVNATMRLDVTSIASLDDISVIANHPAGNSVLTYGSSGLTWPNLIGASTITPMMFKGHFLTDEPSGTLSIRFDPTGHIIKMGSYVKVTYLDNFWNQ